MGFNPEKLDLVLDWASLKPGSFLWVEEETKSKANKVYIKTQGGYFQYIEFDENDVPYLFMIDTKKKPPRTIEYKLSNLKQWTVRYGPPREPKTYKNTRDKLKDYKSIGIDDLEPGTWCAAIVNKSYKIGSGNNIQSHESFIIQFGWFKYIDDDIAVLENNKKEIEVDIDQKFYVKKNPKKSTTEFNLVGIDAGLNAEEQAAFKKAWSKR